MFYCEILSGLWVGDVGIAMNDKFIKDNDISIILNCTTTFEFTSLNVKKIRLPFSDLFDQGKDVQLLKQNKKKLCLFIKNNIFQNNILICCYDGKTISPLICALYIKEYSNIDNKSIYPIMLEKDNSFRLWLDLDLFN